MRPGDIIDGKYRVETALGEGGMGTVWAATHTTIGNTVAIKVLRPEAMRSPEVPARFAREARNMGRLRSEHVIRVIDVGALPTGEPYMVMEMLHGHDLASRLKNGALPPHQAVEYIMQACEGLAEAHAIGMVHRDVKPANLYVTSRPNGAALIKVLDFGIATAASGDVDPRLTATQSVMGSPSYMSPEQLKGARDVDARSDIWSLGVTLYELLTGNQPFTGNTLTALSLAIVTDSHERMVNVPAQLIQIVDKCLEKDRSLRFQNVNELAQALAPLFPGGAVAADMVRGTYSQPVPPTLMGLEQSIGTQPTMAPRQSALVSAPAMNLTTSSLASGETGTKMPSQSRRWVWVTAGIATIAIGIGVGIMVGRSNGNAALADDKPAGPPMTSQPSQDLTVPKKDEPATVKDEPKKDEPKTEVKVDPPAPKDEPATQAKVEEPKVDPKLDPKKIKRKPVTVIKPKPDPNQAQKDKDAAAQAERDRIAAAQKAAEEERRRQEELRKQQEQKNKPCAPNDPRCGL